MTRAKLNIVNTCPMDVMMEAKRKVGIAPITEQNIRDWIEDDDAREHDTAKKIYKSPIHHTPRMNAAISFLEGKLGIPLSEIYIKDVKMCTKPENGILWVESTERFTKRIFYKASIVQDSNIRTLQYSPTETYHRKYAVDNILKDMRKKEEGLKTQVRPGDEDWEIWLKKTSKYEYDNWDVLTVGDIDPNKKVPPMRIIHSKDDPKLMEYLREKTKEVDHGGYATVTNKRKATSPRVSFSKRSNITPDGQIFCKITQVLERNCPRAKNNEEVSDSSDSSDQEEEDERTVIINEEAEPRIDPNLENEGDNESHLQGETN